MRNWRNILKSLSISKLVGSDYKQHLLRRLLNWFSCSLKQVTRITQLLHQCADRVTALLRHFDIYEYAHSLWRYSYNYICLILIIFCLKSLSVTSFEYRLELSHKIHQVKLWSRCFFAMMHIRFIFAFQLPQTAQSKSIMADVMGATRPGNVTVCLNE